MKKPSARLVYLDWMRGLGALIMLQGHVFEGWVRPEARTSQWFWLSQFLGGLPAPIFLFLVGVSLALVLDRMRTKGAAWPELTVKVIRRGSWILLLAYLFRIEQFLVWYPYSDWTGIFKVDTLNCIAVSTLLVGLLSTAFKSRAMNITVMGAVTAAVVFLTPWVYPLTGKPGFIFSYLNGNGNPPYFSVFPWASFTLAGITFGYILLAAKARVGEQEFFKAVAVAGILSYVAGRAMSLSRIFEYGYFDYSLTSPHFFLIRFGWILLILYGAYMWSTRTRASAAWSPLITLGQASLIVYWVHIEIVYGRPFQTFGRSLDVGNAALQLLWLAPLMLLLASHRQLRTAISQWRPFSSRSTAPEIP
jgi:uncharacterized membrane protein